MTEFKYSSGRRLRFFLTKKCVIIELSDFIFWVSASVFCLDLRMIRIFLLIEFIDQIFKKEKEE